MLEPNADIQKAAPVAEYMKIRQYVVGLVVNAGEESVMIPSMPKLGKQFGVARMTVHKALKDLIKDEYLIVRHGIGNFTNPHRLPKSITGKHFKCVGIISGGGKYCFYDHYSWSQCAALGEVIADGGRYIKILTASANSPEQIAAELKTTWIDGLVWIEPDETGKAVLKILKAESFPVVAFQKMVDGIDSIRLDYERHGYETGKRFLKEGRNNTVFVILGHLEYSALQLDGFKRAYAEAGVKFNERLVLKYHPNLPQEEMHVPDNFEALLELGVDVQAVFIDYGAFLPAILEALKKHGVDIKERCRILVGRNDARRAGPEFHGLVRTFPFIKGAEWTASKLDQMLAGNAAEIEHRLIEIPVESME